MNKRNILLILAVCGTLACAAEDNPNAGGSGSETDTETTGITGTESQSTSASTTTSTTDDSASGPGSTSSDTTDPTAGGGGPVACDMGEVYECGDGEDNDGDGLVDLADPECVGPCDNDEGSFATGIPGDNVDCFQDCFFDGNSGHGDDECWWNVTCDPANPGEGGMCAYTDSPMCNMQPPYDNAGNCVDFCQGMTPNGCDCFGCCTIVVDGQEINIWLGSGDDCSLANLDACASCTPNEDCGNTCSPDDCELCFGETELPEGCDEPGGCPEGAQSCTTNPDGTSDCPQGLFCLTGCCAEYVPPG